MNARFTIVASFDVVESGALTRLECLGPLKLCQYFLTKGVGKNGAETVFG